MSDLVNKLKEYEDWQSDTNKVLNEEIANAQRSSYTNTPRPRLMEKM